MQHLDSDTLWQYVTGNSDKTQTEKIEKHLASCGDCRKEFELLSKIESTLFVLDDETVSLGFSDKIILEIEKEVVSKKKNTKLAKLFPYIIFGGFSLATLTAILINVESNFYLIQKEGVFDIEMGMLMLTVCSLLWGLYLIDRIFKKIFITMDYTKFS